jgi:hypothetical protein
MRLSFRRLSAMALLVASRLFSLAQAPTLYPIDAISFETSGPVLRERTTPTLPVTVAGPHGALIGQQNGSFESWILPVKLISHFTIEANVEGYGVPIDVNQQSAEIEVRPDRTTITYTHPTFTVRQIMFSPSMAASENGSSHTPSSATEHGLTATDQASGAVTGHGFSRAENAPLKNEEALAPEESPRTGPIVLFQFDCLHPADFTFRFIPELKWMWPARNEGIPGPEWVASPQAPRSASEGTAAASSGFYVLHTDYPNLAGALTIPGATRGILAPYQERPEFHPLELHLHIDPTRDHNKLYPVLMAAGITPATATNSALASALAQLNTQIPALYTAHAGSWKSFLARSTSISTPDASLNEAFQWATVSIEQLKTSTIPGQSSPPSEQCHPERSTPGAPCEAGGKRSEGSASVSPSAPTSSHSGGGSSGLQAPGSQARTESGALAAERIRPASHSAVPCRPMPSASLYPVILRTGASGPPAARECGWGQPGEGSAAASAALASAAEAPRDSDATWEKETALIAGYYTSADTARPGFGWFFGRDALYTLYAVNGYGDFALSRSELEFLIHRQRADGKIMHEYSQTAAAIDWRAFPYMYAAADSTPLFLLAVADYVRSSGDTAFLTTYRDAIEKAWAFETDPAHDTDHDGIYDNSQGTGWVESWPTGMPHQEIYLALLDQQASSAMAFLASLMRNEKDSLAAKARADAITKTINAEYYDSAKGCYDFSHNLDGANDRTTTVYPALAWWDPAGDKPILNNPEPCLRNFIGSALNTDWGLRDVANTEPLYDGLSYHQGSVWPLFTGWAALAEYRANQPLAGYQLLMENANLTRAQDLGAVTELLSGDFFVPFGRSTSHQLWSSAMVITPTLRGLFGIAIDAQSKTITVNPHLPSGWKDAAIRNVQLPGGPTDITFARDGANLRIGLSPTPATMGWHLRSDVSGTRTDKDEQFGLRLPLPSIGLGTPSHDAPTPGTRTSAFRVLSESWQADQVTLVVQGLAESTAHIPVFRHKLVKLGLHDDTGLANQVDNDHPLAALVAIDTAWRDASIPFALELHFPPGTGFQTLTVTLSW